MSNELKTLAGTMIPALEQEMRTVLKANQDSAPDLLHGMLHYHMGWVDEDLQPLTSNGGKRIRPLVVLLTCAAAGGRWEDALPAAAAVEILHNFSLIHDDIEDASPTRRGRPTLWKLWGEPQAINAGDAMFAIAHLALARLVDGNVSAKTTVTSLRRFDETCVALTQGQHADMDFETRDSVNVDEYIDMITGKTAVLLSLSAELGARVAGASEETAEHYASLGRDLGLAFQVKDDILGIWGDEGRTGKSAATDIITKKKTLPVLYGLSNSEELADLYQNTPADDAFVQKVIGLLDACGADDYANAEAARYSESALEHLNAADPQGEAGTALRQLADMLLQRDN